MYLCVFYSFNITLDEVYQLQLNFDVRYCVSTSRCCKMARVCRATAKILKRFSGKIYFSSISDTSSLQLDEFLAELPNAIHQVRERENNRIRWGSVST